MLHLGLWIALTTRPSPFRYYLPKHVSSHSLEFFALHLSNQSQAHCGHKNPSMCCVTQNFIPGRHFQELGGYVTVINDPHQGLTSDPDITYGNLIGKNIVDAALYLTEYLYLPALKQEAFHCFTRLERRNILAERPDSTQRRGLDWLHGASSGNQASSLMQVILIACM